MPFKFIYKYLITYNQFYNRLETYIKDNNNIKSIESSKNNSFIFKSVIVNLTEKYDIESILNSKKVDSFSYRHSAYMASDIPKYKDIDKNNICRVGTSIGDIAAGLYAVIGILVQLIHRKNTDLGSRLDISMLDCQVAILENAISRFSVEKKIPYPLGTDHPTITPFGAFKTKDSYIVIAIGNDKLFKNFCKAIGSKELFYDNFFKNNELRNKNLKKLRKLVEEKLEKKNTDFWTKIFSEYEVPHSKINNIEEVTNNEQVISRDMILNYNYDSIKNLKISGNPIKLSFVKKKRESKKSPELNENREEIINKFKLNEL